MNIDPNTVKDALQIIQSAAHPHFSYAQVNEVVRLLGQALDESQPKPTTENINEVKK